MRRGKNVVEFGDDVIEKEIQRRFARIIVIIGYDATIMDNAVYTSMPEKLLKQLLDVLYTVNAKKIRKVQKVRENSKTGARHPWNSAGRATFFENLRTWRDEVERDFRKLEKIPGNHSYVKGLITGVDKTLTQVKELLEREDVL